MFRERVIIETYPLTKAKLVEARKSGEFQEGPDFYHDKAENGNRMILWTEAGLKKLLKSKGIPFEEGCVVQGSEQTAHNGEDAGSTPAAPTRSPQITDTVPAIVKQKFPNKRLVACEIRGRWENVMVRDSSLLRVGNIITAIHRGGKWVGHFKIAGNGRIHAP